LGLGLGLGLGLELGLGLGLGASASKLPKTPAVSPYISLYLPISPYI